MTARTREKISRGAWLAHSSAAIPMLPEMIWRGLIVPVTPSLAEAAPAPEPTANAVPRRDSPLSLNAATPTAPAVSAPQSDEELAQELFQHLRDTRSLLRDDERAAVRDHLVLLHAPLVERCARSLMVAGEPLEDLIQEGYVGLIKAVDRFNPAKGAHFSTYAYHLIAGEIRHYLRDLGKLIHEPGWHSELRQKVSRMSEHLTQELGRAPDWEEVSDALEIPVVTVREVLKRHQSLVVESLASESELEDSYPSSAQATAPLEEWVDNQLLLQEALPRLSELERRAVQLFFYEERSKTEIARQLGISVNYAAYLVKRGLKHLRQIMEESAANLKPASCQRPALRLSSLKPVAPFVPCSATCKGGAGQPVGYPLLTQKVGPATCESITKIVAATY